VKRVIHLSLVLTWLGRSPTRSTEQATGGQTATTPPAGRRALATGPVTSLRDGGDSVTERRRGSGRRDSVGVGQATIESVPALVIKRRSMRPERTCLVGVPFPSRLMIAVRPSS
jgi:hypothetical protein